ncbi:S8 family peptidase [Streptomyces sp. 5.8]|uniref:S8 family peptidase n=1 Tax=Streptomyces sp. 5.8 TaxID=3406571 RepID=UPI003BB5CB6D
MNRRDWCRKAAVAAGAVALAANAPTGAWADTQTDAPWGLARISQAAKLGQPPLRFTYDPKWGQGVNVYVLGTGINTTHDDLAGRVAWGTNTTDDGTNGDCHGESTHVAATAVGTRYGVAKKAKVVAVKAVGCNGGADMPDVIAAVQWVRDHANGLKGNVLLLGVVMDKNTELDKAIEAAADQNIVVVVAHAGNTNQDACQTSPARAPKAITVGATDPNDLKATSSNYGKCVDILAPGVDILSASSGSRTAIKTRSGTSMAAAHTAGVAAALLSEGVRPADTATKITSLAARGVITDLDSTTPNLLLQVPTRN